MSSTPAQSDADLAARAQRRAFRALVLAATCGTIAYQVFAGNFLSLFVHRFGFSPFLIGTLFLVIQAPAVLQIWGARYIDRHGARRLLLICYGISPLTVLTLVLAPQMRAGLGATAGALAIFLGAVAFMFLNAVSTAGWMMLLRRNLPKDRIAALLGRMNRIAMFCGLGATLAFSLFLGNEPHLWKFQVVFVAGAAVAGLRALRLREVADIERAPRHRPEPLHEDLTAIWNDLPFRRLLIFTAIVFLAGGMTTPFRPLFITTLGFSERFAAIMTVPVILGAYGAGAPVWGALTDRYGSRGVYVLAGIGVAAAQWFFLLPQGNAPVDALWVTLAVVGNAFCWGGFDAANMRRLYTLTPVRSHSLYMVAHNLALFVSLSVGSFLGGVLLKTLRPFTEQAGDGRFARGLDYRVLFLVASILFIIAIGYSRRMLKLQEMSTPRLVLYLRLRTQRWLLDGLAGDLVRRIWPEEETEGEQEKGRLGD